MKFYPKTRIDFYPNKKWIEFYQKNGMNSILKKDIKLSDWTWPGIAINECKYLLLGKRKICGQPREEC